MYYLKNYMEEVVDSKLNKLLDSIDMCRCEKCKLDIKAIALNKLPPRYVVTDKGNSYSKLNEMEMQFEVDVETAIIKAAMIVGKNPRHQAGEE